MLGVLPGLRGGLEWLERCFSMKEISKEATITGQPRFLFIVEGLILIRGAFLRRKLGIPECKALPSYAARSVRRFASSMTELRT